MNLDWLERRNGNHQILLIVNVADINCFCKSFPVMPVGLHYHWESPNLTYRSPKLLLCFCKSFPVMPIGQHHQWISSYLIYRCLYYLFLQELSGHAYRPTFIIARRPHRPANGIGIAGHILFLLLFQLG